MQYIKLLRIKQWIKNLLVLAPLVFAQQLGDSLSIYIAGFAFISFCLTASGLYVLNDIFDADADRNHPVKRNRPIASGEVSPSTAVFLFLGLIISGLGLALYVSSGYFMTVLVYVFLISIYSRWLKREVILDVLVVAVGFVIRAYAGAVAISVDFSPWLLITTLFLALFLVLGKRRHELMVLGEDAAKHRKILGEYSQRMLDQLIVLVATISLASYLLYTMWPSTVERFGSTDLVYTLPIVVYGLFRYFYLIYQKNSGGDPTEMLINDFPLLLSIILWGGAVVAVLYY